MFSIPSKPFVLLQMMLDPQWAAPMTMLTALHPTTPTPMDLPLVTDLMDTAMGRDPRLAPMVAPTVMLRAPCPTMVVLPVPSLMVAQTVTWVAHMMAQMVVPMEVS